VTKIGDFVVDFLREFKAISKKALTCVSGAFGEMFYEEKKTVENLVPGSPEIPVYAIPFSVQR
jgi:hypothetical protein